jgi:hypothetical protein
MADHLLLETGDDLLLEDGASFLLLEEGVVPPAPEHRDDFGDLGAPAGANSITILHGTQRASHGADAPTESYDPDGQFIGGD